MLTISSQLSGILEADEKIPVGMVHVYDTTFTVPSNGFFVKYFSGVQYPYPGSGSLKRTQFEPIIMKDWSNGLPVELSNYVGTRITNSGQMVSDPFTIIYTGYFYSPNSGLYNFSTRSNGEISLAVNNTQLYFGSQNSKWPGQTAFNHPMDYVWQGNIHLASGWIPYSLNFYWTRSIVGTLSGSNGNPFLTAYYRAPGMETSRIMSASSVNYRSGFLQPIILNNLIQTSESVDQNLSTQFDFEVAMTVSGDYSWDKARDDFGRIRINRLCKVFQGYVTESGYNYTSGYTANLGGTVDGMVEKFTGFIDNVSVNQTSQQLVANVKCRDFSKRLINAINENYPNRANYSQTVVSGVDRFGAFDINRIMPNAYDRWPVFDVIETVALNGGIDPVKINRAKWDNQNHFIMESNLNWPRTDTVSINNIVTKDGDPFLFKFEYGETLDSEVKKVANLIGYNSYFDEAGDLVVKEPTRTNRIEIYESGNYGSKSIFYSGNWFVNFNINASNRVYVTPYSGPILNTGIFRMTFSGVGMGIYQTLHPSGNLYSVNIYDANTNSLVFNNTYTNSGALSYGNVREFTRDLPYGKYNAFIYPSGDLRIEGAEYYTQNVYRPVYTFRDDRDIVSINVDHNDYTTRNEIIAVGQQISDKGYLYSKAIDLDSISNPDAFNYLGEKRTATIIEPTIQSQPRLDWLARSILQKYRRKQKNISVATQGLPHIQINDPVGIRTNKLNLNSDIATYDDDNEEIYYVTNISSNLSRGKYTSNFTLTSLKPIESWRPPLSITNDILRIIYGGNDNSIFANFRQDTLNTTILTGYGYNGFSKQAAFVSFDLLVDVDRLWVLVSDTTDGLTAFQNIDVNSKDGTITYQYGQNQNDSTPSPQGAVWLHNGGGEKWGRMVVPTAQNDFNGGQWVGQNSLTNIRKNGVYPIAIWAQFRTADSAIVNQGIWVPISGTLDNRNRAYSWSATASGNTFIAFNANNQGATIQAPLNPTLQQAYLPAFAVENDPVSVNLWIGPPESGYKMVEDNRLISMTSKFQYGGNEWNSGPMFEYVKNPNLGNVKTYRENSPDGITYSINSPGSPTGPIKVKTDNYIWKTGDNILFEGGVPGAQDVVNEVFYAYSYLSPRNFSSTTGIRTPNKALWGFAPQGFDIRSRVSAQADYLKQFNAFEMSYWPQIPNVIETVGHPANYLTLRLNHDSIVELHSYHIHAKPDGNPACVGAYIKSTEVPIAGDLAIYLTPGGGDGNNRMLSKLYINEQDQPGYSPLWYDVYKRAGNVLNLTPSWNEYITFSSWQIYGPTAQEIAVYSTVPGYAYLLDTWKITQARQPHNWADEGSYFIMHFIKIIESETGRQYYFALKNTMGRLMDFGTRSTADSQGVVQGGYGFLNKFYRPPSFLCRPGEGIAGDYRTQTIVAPRILH